MADVINAFANDRFMSTFVISDIRVHIYGSTKCCIFIVDVSTRDQASVFFLERITFGEGTDMLSRKVGSQLAAELLNTTEQRRHHLVQ